FKKEAQFENELNLSNSPHQHPLTKSLKNFQIRLPSQTTNGYNLGVEKVTGGDFFEEEQSSLETTNRTSKFSYVAGH
ncbi:hypothetical protein, partial [Levilactobacillus andaensis]|uniref:hypothetical protein n=1 Tax=Levilactobacillus andaensis TaxID=2799570 RepID=UPI0019445049